MAGNVDDDDDNIIGYFFGSFGVFFGLLKLIFSIANSTYTLK